MACRTLCSRFLLSHSKINRIYSLPKPVSAYFKSESVQFVSRQFKTLPSSHRVLTLTKARTVSQRFYSWDVEDNYDKGGAPKVHGEICYEELQALLTSKDIQLIDVRESREIEEYGKIDRSINIPLGELRDALQLAPDQFKALYGAPKPSTGDSNVVFHCLAGVRSFKALNFATEQGYTKARHYKGGWEEYTQRVGLPLKKTQKS